MNAPIRRTLLFASLGILLLQGCGGSEATDKRAQLEQYKKQAAELQDKITQLEKEIGVPADSVRGGNRRLVAVGSPRPRPFTHYIVVPGYADSRENVTVSAETGGRVTRLVKKEGDRVRKGEIIVRLDAGVLQRNLEEVQTQMELAETVYQRRKRLWEEDNIGSEVQYLEAKNQYESLQSRAATLREQISQTLVKAPISGFVDRVDVKVGQMASPGLPVARVVDLRKMRILADVSERYIGSIDRGDTAEVYIPTIDYRAELPLTHVSQVVDPNNRTFEVEIEIHHQKAPLKPNMQADVKLADYRNPDAVVLPSNVIQRTERGNFVFVVEERQGGPIAAKRMVETGLTYQGMTEIREGVTPQSRVITEGARIVTDGEPVRIAASKKAATDSDNAISLQHGSPR